MPPLHRPRRERFNSVDASWLHMDTPCNQVMIVSLGLFDQRLRYAALRAVVEDRLLRFDRFRQRVREPRRPLALPTWEPDPDFSLDHHLRTEELPPPGDWPALLRLVEGVMRQPLDPCRPQWRMHLVERYGAGSALIMCVSHAVADGAAMMHLLQTFTGDTAAASRRRLRPDEIAAPRQTAAPRRPTALADRVVGAINRLESALDAPAEWLDHGVAALSNPVETALRGAHAGLALGKLLFIPPDRRSLLSGRCGPDKRVAASEPLPLAEVKAIAHGLDAKINDVVLSAVAGGFRRYLVGHGQSTRGLDLRALVPVYLGAWDQAVTLQNGFGLVFLPLPVGVVDPERRLRVLRRRMDGIKTSPEAAIAYGILGGLGYTPRPLEHLITRAFAIKATAVMTNVPGPRQPRYLAGVPMRRMLFWVPQPAGLAVGVSVFSYAGELNVTVGTDARVVPDPQAIVAGFHAELRVLAERCSARVAPAAPPAKRAARPAGSPARGVARRAAAARCEARTQAGRRCHNHALPGTRRCAVHSRVLEPA
jgi:WS/DGAT/MGAT family acyltransferase